MPSKQPPGSNDQQQQDGNGHPQEGQVGEMAPGRTRIAEREAPEILIREGPEPLAVPVSQRG